MEQWSKFIFKKTNGDEKNILFTKFKKIHSIRMNEKIKFQFRINKKTRSVTNRGDVIGRCGRQRWSEPRTVKKENGDSPPGVGASQHFRESA